MRAVRRAIDAVAGDVRAFGRQVRANFGDRLTRPGLRAHRIEADGGERRLHLRVHDDGTGALFVDVTHVVHLTPTAVQIAGMLLDDAPATRVTRVMRQWYPDAPTDALEAEVRDISVAIEALKQPGGDCPTCLPELAKAPVFSTRAEAPYKADLALTYTCNNDCAHCYNEPGRRGIEPLAPAGWRAALRKLADIGVPHIIFTGGEPTLSPDLPELIRYASRIGQVTGVNTNGRRLAKPGHAPGLKAAGLDHIQVTLASHLPEVHNRVVSASAHAETVAGIRAALSAGLHTITNTTLTADTAPRALGTVDFIHSLGIGTFAMNGMICSGGGRLNPSALTEADLVPVLQSVRERAEDLGMRFLWYTPTEHCRLSPLELGLGAKACNAAEYSICIEPNGDVLPCQSYYEPAGNLLADEWPEIWNGDLFTRIRHRRESPAAAGLPARCIECDDLPICGGGCPLQRAERLEEAMNHA